VASQTDGSLVLAPDVPSIEALGATSADDFFAVPPRTATAPRSTRSGDAWRVALPGTPDEHGRQHEQARGAGTGYLLVRAWRSGGVELARARLTTPRSTSLAARHWNLACHLRAHGIVAPQLVAFGQRGSAIAARESFLIVRELEGFVPLSRWLETTRDARERRRGMKSLGLALAALFRSRTWLPQTALDNVHVAGSDGDCAALQITNLRSEQGLLRERDLVRARLPAVAFTALDGGRIVRRIDLARRVELLRALAAPGTERELAYVARFVFDSRGERRAALELWRRA
jgi:hypothetical protein